MITGISGFGCLVQKWPFRDAKTLLKPLFYSVFWVRGQVVKKGNFGQPPKKLITEKLFFGIFGVFFVFLAVFLFFGGFKGQVRRATSLGPKPSLFIIYFYWGGLFFPFFSSLFNTKKTGFSPREGHFLFICESLPLFFLSLFWPPLFQFFFLCLSLVFFSSFFWFFFLSFCLFLSFVYSLLLFHERNNIKTFNCNLFSSIFCFLGVWLPVLFFAVKSLFIFVFPHFKLWFLLNMHVFGFKTIKNTSFWSRGGVATKRFHFYQPVFCKIWKVIVFFGGGPFWANFGWSSKTL